MKKAVDLSNLLTQAGSIAIEKKGFHQKLFIYLCINNNFSSKIVLLSYVYMMYDGFVLVHLVHAMVYLECQRTAG